MSDRVKKIVSIAILSSIAIVLSILESFIPFNIPGVKIGLANAVVLVVLYLYGKKEAILVQYVRILLVGLIYSGIVSYSFLISLISGTISIIVMVSLSYIKKISITSISVISAISHSLTEILVAYLILNVSSVFLYIPILLLIALPLGVLSSYISILVLKSFRIDVVKPKYTSIIVMSLIFIISLSFTIVYSFTKEKDYEGRIATIYYDNNEIMNINLDKPSEYKVIIRDNFTDYYVEENSYIYVFNVYNKDEKEYFDLIVEVKDGKIRIKDDTSKKHIARNTGFISTKYESLICLPNSFVITIDYLSLDDIDALM